MFLCSRLCLKLVLRPNKLPLQDLSRQKTSCLADFQTLKAQKAGRKIGKTFNPRVLPTFPKENLKNTWFCDGFFLQERRPSCLRDLAGKASVLANPCQSREACWKLGRVTLEDAFHADTTRRATTRTSTHSTSSTTRTDISLYAPVSSVNTPPFTSIFPYFLTIFNESPANTI